MTWTNLRKLQNYDLVLTSRTFYAFYLAHKFLRGSRYPRSVYFNLALLIPIFLDYSDLVTPNSKASLKQTILTSTLMLLEDILLDEEKVDIGNLQTLFISPESFQAKSNTEKLTKNLANVLWKVLPKRNKELLESLNSAQIKTTQKLNFEDFYEASITKGQWYPALAYSLNANMSEEELTTMTLLGFWIKCVDDLVDLDEDRASQTVTVYTHEQCKLEPETHLNNLHQEVFTKIRTLSYPSHRIELFLYRTSVAVCTFRLYNEFRKKLPKWYSHFCDQHVSLQLINLLFATFIGLGSLLRIE